MLGDYNRAQAITPDRLPVVSIRPEGKQLCKDQPSPVLLVGFFQSKL